MPSALVECTVPAMSTLTGPESEEAMMPAPVVPVTWLPATGAVRAFTVTEPVPLVVARMPATPETWFAPLTVTLTSPAPVVASVAEMPTPVSEVTPTVVTEIPPVGPLVASAAASTPSPPVALTAPARLTVILPRPLCAVTPSPWVDVMVSPEVRVVTVTVPVVAVA